MYISKDKLVFIEFNNTSHFFNKEPSYVIDFDVFVMGHDWEGKFDFLKEYCEVVYLPRTEGISTSKIKNDLGLKGQQKKD